MADDTRITALAEYKSKRINENGFSCAGFAGKDGKTGNKFQLYPIDYDEIVSGEDSTHNAILVPGDTLVVP